MKNREAIGIIIFSIMAILVCIYSIQNSRAKNVFAKAALPADQVYSNNGNTPKSNRTISGNVWEVINIKEEYPLFNNKDGLKGIIVELLELKNGPEIPG